MKAVTCIGVILLTAATVLAQTPAPAKKAVKKAAHTSTTAADVQALKDAVAAQQQQIQALQGQLQQTNQQLQQTSQQFQQTQAQLQQAQQAAADAQQKAAAAVEAAAAPKEAVDHLSSQMTDVQTTLTNNALTAQDDQKKITALEATLGRFRWTGDMRVRGETFAQSYSGCAICDDRNRARVRVRFGFEGKLNEDFTAGVALATGSLGDPTTTNETLTNNFDRKTIGLDRGYITYNPVAHKWLSLTGGKFAYTWARTSLTFDPDISPEGFVEKFSKDLSGVPMVKNVNIQFMQLLFNEVAGTSTTSQGLYSGRDSFVVGGQIGAVLQPLKFWTLTPSFTLLNFRYPDALLNSSAFAVQATSTGNVLVLGTNGKVATFQVPGEGPGCNDPKSTGLPNIPQPPNAGPPNYVGGCVMAANGMTNSTYIDSASNIHFLSGFEYADLILNNQFKTGLARLPLNLLLEYENNLNAAAHPFDYTVKGAIATPSASENTKLGKQSHAYMADISIGQQKKAGDLQFGYAYEREEQDAAIASWGESDQRAPTNILQHRVYALWRVRQNTTASFTWWHGRTLNPFLQNSALAPGLQLTNPSGSGYLAPGASEPWLNRLQFDLIYTF